MSNHSKPKRKKSQKAYYLPRVMIDKVAEIAQEEERSQSVVAIRLIREGLRQRGIDMQTA